MGESTKNYTFICLLHYTLKAGECTHLNSLLFLPPVDAFLPFIDQLLKLDQYYLTIYLFI